MKKIISILGLGLLCLLFTSMNGGGHQAKASSPPLSSDKPGDMERAALSKMEFVVGEWEGEGWSLTPSGQRARFWVKESYRYRGDKDLMDMEGRFGGILPDGTRSAEREYSLGILYYDRERRQYRSWHYSNDGVVFTVDVDVDIERKTAQYRRTTTGGESSRFSIRIDENWVWISTVEILTPDKTWLQVVEFRMRRLKS